MPEVQTATQSGEMTQRFIEFIMMQAQNAALFMGQIPHPQTGQPEKNLEVARMFIDQLGMIQEKTRGNLSSEEEAVLRNTLSGLQLAFVEASSGESGTGAAAPLAKDKSGAPEKPSDISASATDEKPSSEQSPPATETESRKKFTKSYGA